MMMNEDRTMRQIRSMPAHFRAASEGGKKRIEGYFATFDGIYTLWPGATESVDPHAFDETLGDDVRALIDHETRLVLGRSTAKTLELKVDSKGLWGSIDINEADTDAMNLYARVERGDVSQCSFGFDILDEETTYDEKTGAVHWTIKKVKLWEVSCVTFPAYENTSITARKNQYDQIKKRQVDAWRSAMKARLKHGA
jgi:HK97 family phage prohead protease